jgi:hypothetical protein
MWTQTSHLKGNVQYLTAGKIVKSRLELKIFYSNIVRYSMLANLV